MSSAVTGYDAFCQSCEKRFELSEIFTQVVNLDIEGFEKQKFFEGTLNRVTCPLCKKEFTYEVPMIVFSLRMKFACLVFPNLTPDNTSEIKAPPYLIMPNGFMFRIVRYQIEALEKYRIISSGLNDIDIELIKLEHFTDEESMPFDEKNIVFKSFENGAYNFNQVDYNNNILKEICIDNPILGSDTEFKNFCRFKWLKIDRETLKEDGLCQN